MADELRLFLPESNIAEHMIIMNMRVDHITDRQRGYAPHGLSQRAADGGRAASVDHRDTFVADDEADIGDIVIIGMLQPDMFALMHVNPRGDFAQVERFSVCFCGASRAARRRQKTGHAQHKGEFRQLHIKVHWSRATLNHQA